MTLASEPWEMRGANDARIRALETAADRLNGDTAVPGSTSTGSTSFVDWGTAPLEVTFTKRHASTYFQIIYFTSLYVTVDTGAVTYAVKNMATGVDHAVGVNHFLNALGQHMGWSAVITPTDTAPGPYTYRFRWRVSVNAPTLNLDSNDYAQFIIQERLITPS